LKPTRDAVDGVRQKGLGISLVSSRGLCNDSRHLERERNIVAAIWLPQETESRIVFQPLDLVCGLRERSPNLTGDLEISMKIDYPLAQYDIWSLLCQRMAATSSIHIPPTVRQASSLEEQATAAMCRQEVSISDLTTQPVPNVCFSILLLALAVLRPL
jgi:hypothetical protein